MDSETEERSPGGREPRPLPVGSTAVGAWRTLVDGWDVLARLGLLMVVVAGLLLLLEPVVERLHELHWPEWLLSLLLDDLLVYASWGYVGSHWFRFLLVGREDVRATFPRWTRSETRLFCWLFGFFFLAQFVGLLLVIPLIPLRVLFQTIPVLRPWDHELSLAAFLLASAYLGIRFFLAFPAVAVRGPGSTFSASWRATRGNGWRLLAACLLVHLPLALPLWMVYRLSSTGALAVLWIRLSVIVPELAALVVMAAALALAYRHLVLSRPETFDDGHVRETKQPDAAAEAGVRPLARRPYLVGQNSPDEEAPRPFRI